MTTQPSPEPFSEPTRPPVEARLVQAGKLSMGQLAQAHRDRLETGAPLLDIVVERGWVTREDIAELEGEGAPAMPAPPAPEPVAVEAAAPPSDPEPAAQPEPAAEPEPVAAPQPDAVAAAPETPAAEPEPASGEQHVLVGIRLTTGDLVPAGHARDADTAATLGQAVVAELTQAADGEWPFFDGRFIKPETIVSVDLVVED
jgi:hypothetical protein